MDKSTLGSYKQSQYLLSSPLSTNGIDYWIFYNSLFRSLAVVPNSIKGLIENHKFGEIPDRTLESLKKGLMIIDSAIDERKCAIEFYMKQAYDTRLIDFTLLTTYACNFDCVYCNQKGLEASKYNAYLTNDLIDLITDWMVNLTKSYSTKKIVLGFFGGEPLLNIDAITYTIEQINKKTQNLYNDLEKAYWITTNAYLLSPKVAEKLVDLKVNYYQITLDGPKEVHDKRRFLKNKGGTFDVILSNVNYLCKTLKQSVTISMNVDDYNYQYVYDLLNVLERNELISLVKLNIDGVIPTREIPQGSLTEFIPYSHLEMINYAIEKGFEIMDNPNIGLCPYQSKHTFIIDPLGDLYKCVAAVGESGFKCGSVFESTNDRLMYENHAGNLPWIHDDKCMKCKFLPMCWGGCRNQANIQKQDKCSIYCKYDDFDRDLGKFLRNKLLLSHIAKK